MPTGCEGIGNFRTFKILQYVEFGFMSNPFMGVCEGIRFVKGNLAGITAISTL